MFQFLQVLTIYSCSDTTYRYVDNIIFYRLAISCLELFVQIKLLDFSLILFHREKQVKSEQVHAGSKHSHPQE